jgi:hypothetical protein
MRELSEIIESLHKVNQQIIEKDNYINLYSEVISLISQLTSDIEFKKSDVYLDLRSKYLIQIEEKLEKIKQSKITIEPEHLFENDQNQTKTTDLSNKNTKPKKTKVQSSPKMNHIIAPIKTDIYASPSTRFIQKKKKVQNKEESKENEPDEPQYIEFEYKQKFYYIDTTPLAPIKNNLYIYNIYDNELQIAGNLKQSQIILLNPIDLSKSETIQLKCSSNINNYNQNDLILNTYILQT